jgi:hypothetical protein
MEMARLSKSVLGEISGKMGNLVIRKMNGQEFVSQRPVKYKKTKKRIPGRQKMQSAVQFSCTVNNSEKLKLIWGKSKIKATNSYHKLIKHSLENAETGGLTIKNKITPGGISLSFSDFLFENGKLNVTIANRDKETRSITGNNFSVYILFYFYEPNVKRIDNSTLKLISKDFDAVAENNFPFNYDAAKLNQKALKNYKKCIVYFAMVGNKPNIKTPIYSDTIAEEFIIN